jgi:hypothetical protein
VCLGYTEPWNCGTADRPQPLLDFPDLPGLKTYLDFVLITLMAQRSFAANVRYDPVYDSEGQASSNQPSGSHIPEEKQEKSQALQVSSPVESKSRLGRLLSARSIQGRRIRRGLYASFLTLLIVVWTIVVTTFTGHEIQQQGVNPYSDEPDILGFPTETHVRYIGNDQRTLLRMT